MRNKILEDAKILDFIDFGDFKVFESAWIQTMIYIIKKIKDNQNYEVKYSRIENKDFDKDNLDEFLLDSESNEQYSKHLSKIDKMKYIDKMIDFVNDSKDEVLWKITSNKVIYLTDKEVAQWIVYPQDYLNEKNNQILWNKYEKWDGVFVLSDHEKNSLNFTDKELDVIKPIYSTTELSRYSSNPKNGEWVIYTDSSFKNLVKITEYSNIKTHLDKFSSIITSDNKPYWLHRARDERFFVWEKIIAIRKCAVPSFTYVPFDSYVSATFYVIKTDRINMKFLTGLLNSKLIEFRLKSKWKMQGNNFQLDKDPLINIPIKIAGVQEENAVAWLVDLIMNKKIADSKTDTSDLEKEIDGIIYKLYELTDEEIAIVEEGVKR